MKSRAVLSSCILLLLAGMVSAANFRFTGSVDNLWTKPENWREGALPGTADKCEFVNGAECILDGNAGEVKQIAVSAGASHLTLVDGALVSTNNWTIVGYNGGSAEERHSLEILGGTVTAGARVFVGFTGYGHLAIDYSGVLNLNAQWFGVGEGDNGDGHVELRGGSLNLLSSLADSLRFRSGPNSSASMDFSGGMMTQAYSDARLAVVDGAVADGTITAYGGVGAVLVETVDDIITVKGRHPMNPIPGDGESITPGNITLNWTLDAGTPVDVWFGTSRDLSAAELIVDKQTVTSVAVQVEKKQRYYWAVDTYAPGAEDPNWGPIFDFYVDNLAPAVRASDDVTTWLDNGSVDVAISATVTDQDPTTTLWVVLTEPAAGAAQIADAAAEATTVTLSAVGTYELQIAANDGEKMTADTLFINVYNDGCEAAQSLPDYVPLVGDLDEDCDVDQDDMDLLLENWLQCVTLGECDPRE